MGKLGETGLFLMGMSAAILTITSVLKDHNDSSRDFCREPIGGEDRFWLDER